MEHVLPWINPALFAASLIYTFVSNRGKVAEARVAQQDTRISVLEREVAELRGDVQHMPDKELTHRLEMSLSELASSVRVMEERLKPISATTMRLQDYLFDQGKGR